MDVRSARLGRALGVEQQGHGVLGEALEAELLQVEDDLGDVLFDVRDSGELMRDTVDLDRRDRRAPQGREQHTTKRVSECGAESWVQRLHVELAVVRAVLEL